MKWIIEKDLFIAEPTVVRALQDCDICYELVSYIDILKMNDAELEWKFFWGGIRTAKFIQRKLSCWFPGVYANWPDYHYNRYAYNQTQFLNYHSILTNSFILSKPKKWAELCHYFSSDSLFIKPNEGHKPFIAQVVKSEEEFKDITASLAWLQPIIVCRPQKIYQEERFIIHQKREIAGSEYLNEGQIAIGPSSRVLKEFVQGYVESVCMVPFSDPVIVIDACQTEDGPKLLEINAISTSDWYGCDPKRIIDAISH